jgi:hypothetical protein
MRSLSRWPAISSVKAVRVGDNEVVYIARAFVEQAQFRSAIARVQLPPQVVSVTPVLGKDWGGEPSVFFKVIIADDAVPRSELLALTKSISHAIVHRIRPLEEWGVLPYFDFLTQSDAARIPEPSWA